MASVAIVAPDGESSALYYDGLLRCELPRLRHVVDQDFSFEAGVEVTDIEQVKGLEFDYVIVVDVDARSYAENDSSRRRLHVAATRAIHQLWLTCVGTPSPLVATSLAGAQPVGRGG
jgi:DNA helicase-2/ATP-dependent DNA helicase PcrA